MKKESFGEFFKEKRIALGLTLREFCEKHNLDPGNISKLERSKLPPPKEDILEKYAKALKIKKDTEEWYEFFDLASIESKRLPPECSEKDIAEKLPLLFRTIRDKKLSKEKLEKLIKMLWEA